MLTFAWPWIILLLPLPWLYVHFSRRKSGIPIATIRFPKLQQLQISFTNQQKFSAKNVSWQKVLMSIAWILLIISLMRPEAVQDVGYAQNSGYDLLLAVDLSRSMDTVDFVENDRPISRITATKKVVGNFVRNREGDRVGLIVFADQAYMTIPLSLDTKSVGKMLDNLMVGMAGERTAIGDAIGIGVQALRRRPIASRVLILLTDGEDTASHIPPLVAAKIAKEAQIKIYTIGVGNQLDAQLLQEIAAMTGGTYSPVSNVNDLEAVYKEIDQLEMSEAKQHIVLIRKPLYHLFTLLALACCLIVYMSKRKQFKVSHGF